MSYLPCKNPSCHSYGKPHPNCRCYAAMAEGGDVSFCSRDRPHGMDCEYYAEGGSVSFDSLPDDQEASAAPMFDELKEDDNHADFDSLPDDQETYSTPGQQVATVAEGLAQGVAGPLATAAELGLSKLGVPGMTAEAQAGRQAANPWEHGISEGAGLAGSLLTGVGEAALAGKAAIKAAEFVNLSKTGANMLKGAITSGVIQGGDEVSKWILGQGDPNDAAGAATHVGAAALFGLIPGAAGKIARKTIGQGLEKIAETKVGAKIADYLAGFAAAASGGKADIASSAYNAGHKAFDSFLDKGITSAAQSAGSNLGTYAGSAIGGPVGSVIGANLGKAVAGPVGSILQKIAGPASKKYIAPLTLKILSAGDSAGILDALTHVEDMTAGYNSVAKGVEALFQAGTNASIDAYGSEKDRQKLDDYISSGGIDQNIQQQIYDQNEAQPPQGFAKGGEVQKAPDLPKDKQSILKDNDGLAMHYPEHNLALSMAKGRISNYLRALRPQDNAPRLAFDDAPDMREQKKTYHRALDIANAPLGVLKEIGSGTIEPEHIKHLDSMYPELNGLMQKKLTEHIVKAQVSGEKPKYKIRQGLSMLMGTALSSELTPQNIQAAQAAFAPRQAASQPPQQNTNKKSTSTLSKSDSAYLTGSQALQKRAQKI